MMKVIGVIPARYGSSRFPGKPLADICGKSMLRRVYEQACKSKNLSKVVIATDDSRIYEHAKTFTENVFMTSTEHRNGTERIAEVMTMDWAVAENYDAVINIQGDEPFIDPKQIDEAVEVLILNDKAEVGTLKMAVETEMADNKNKVKVVTAVDGKALYFSRSMVPFDMEGSENVQYFVHIGLYVFRLPVLQSIVKMQPTVLEQSERLEQLRWLENSINIYVKETKFESYGIDVPEDIESCLKIYKEKL